MVVASERRVNVRGPDFICIGMEKAGTGWLYPVVAGLAGVVMIVEATLLWRRARAGRTEIELRPMRLFHLSNTYLALVFLAAAVDPLIF